MRILLTNDDGIYAPGIGALKSALSAMAEVEVVAPISEQSAVGHSITVHSPLRVIEVDRGDKFFGYGVNGAPADCVKLALTELLKQRPDMVVSGINLGANTGIDVLYSGTVAAAIEGAMHGIPSLAVSIEMADRPQFEPAAQIVSKLIRKMPLHLLNNRVILNVNIPALPPSELKGVKITRQSSRGPEEAFDRRIDPRGRHYYWIVGGCNGPSEEEETDVKALCDGYVSITPLHYDLTSYSLLPVLAKWDLGVGLV